MTSEKLGQNTLAEVTNISQHGFWLFFNGKEHFAPFDKFPWFTKASVKEILNVESTSTGKLYWPDIDVDLSVEILDNPEKFRLISKM